MPAGGMPERAGCRPTAMGIGDSKALVQVLRIRGIGPCFNERERHVPTPFAGRFSEVVLALLCVVLCVVS